jgi:hypothetical protein
MSVYIAANLIRGSEDMEKPKFYPVLIYEWPWSQNCMDCKYGERMSSKTFSVSCYLCLLGYPKNDGEYCPRKEVRK